MPNAFGFTPRFMMDDEAPRAAHNDTPIAGHPLDYDLLADKIAIRLFAMLVTTAEKH